MDKGTIANPNYKIRAHITSWATGNHAASETTSRLPRSNVLFVEGPVTGGCSQGTTRPLAAGSSGGTHYGNDEHQLHHEGQGHWDNFYGHFHHFCGVNGPWGPWLGNSDHGTHH